MKKCETILLIFLVLLFSCDREGYSLLKKNVEYKLISFETELEGLEQDDLVVLNIEDSRYVELSQKAYVVDSKTYGLENMLKGFSTGDSISLRLDPDFFQFDQPSDKIDIEIKIERTIKANDQSNMNRELSVLKESALISQYMINKKINPKESMMNGVYILDRPERSNSEKIKSGDQISMNYITQFLSGVELANSSTSQSLDFTVGQEEQVLLGVERAIEFMCIGEKFNVLIPSDLAYGSKGSAGGLIPPYTPLLMELQFQRVRLPK